MHPVNGIYIILVYCFVNGWSFNASAALSDYNLACHHLAVESYALERSFISCACWLCYLAALECESYEIADGALRTLCRHDGIFNKKPLARVGVVVS